jgi:Domain of unknown function (DUF4157)
MERSFGSSFEDVRVHDASPAAAYIGARAVTIGADIHLAPGEPSSGVASDALLGHELAHVVQQRQRRVAPATQTGAPALNSDPQLEREADIQGIRAANGQRAGAQPTHPVRAPECAAQAKFGFEFQTANSFVAYRDERNRIDFPIVGEKELAFEDTTKKFKVEGDEGSDAQHFDVEFITSALTTAEEAKTAVEGAAALAADLDAAWRKPVTRTAGQKFGTGTWKRPVAIEIFEKGFHAKPQASVGVSLADIPQLLSSNLFLGSEGPMRKTVTEQAKSVETTDQWKTWRTSPALHGFLELVLYYVRAAGQRNPVDTTGSDPEAFPTLGNQVITTDGPKAMFSIMARTDFHSMFKALPARDQTLFIEGLIGDVKSPSPNPELSRIIGANLNEPMITAPYRADKVTEEDRKRFRIETHKDTQGRPHEIVMAGPTILDWLLSIATGRSHKDAEAYAVRNRDMLSAPVGWGSRAADATGFPTAPEIVEQQIYGMGAYPIDEPGTGNLAIFELRNLSGNLTNSLPRHDQWWTAAQAAINNAFAAWASSKTAAEKDPVHVK